MGLVFPWPVHHEIPNYCRITSKAHANVLRNSTVMWSRARLPALLEELPGAVRHAALNQYSSEGLI